MKFFVVALALIAAVAADVSELPSSEYLPPVSQEYIPPVQDLGFVEPAHSFDAQEGYKYKTVKRYRLRHRRDVSELGAPSSEYLPPVDAPVQEYIPPFQAEVEPAHTFDAQEGYKYKTVKRYRLRRRRDVSDLGVPSTDYLPPVDQALSPEFIAPPQDLFEPEPAHVFGAEGYKYKTVKRLRHRRRRDVSELAIPTGEYLPPVEQEFLPAEPAFVEPAHTFDAQEGYKYKTVRRLRHRRRRDVSELAVPTGEYLPPVEQEFLPVEPAFVEPAHTFDAQEGYKYKTVKRLRHRRRRDVSELGVPSTEYLPPVDAPVQEYIPPFQAEIEPAHTFDAQEGYKYKTVKRLRHRRRRDVSELGVPSTEYLPPIDAPVQEYIPPFQAEVEPAHVFDNEGYKYKTVKRFRLRHRRY